MITVTITEAKAKLGKLTEQAAAGEIVVITRRGKPVAQLIAARKPIDFDAIRELTKNMTYQETSAGDFIRWMRDTDRY